MMTMSIIAGLVYFAVGCGVAVLSMHELATGDRLGLRNRLMALGAAILWLPTLLLVMVGAGVAAFRPAERQIAPVRAAVARHRRNLPSQQI